MRNFSIFLIIFYGIILHCAIGEKDKVNSKLDFNTSDEDSGASSNHGGNKKSPKIQGVRVTVDTGNGKTKKSTAAESGSKESVEIVESKKGKRVGIHTDITFELTDGDDNNSTSSDKDDTDASVPVYKGRDRATTHRPRKPYDPKAHWRPNQPHHRDSPSIHRNSYNPYPRTNSEDELYRGLNDWSGFIPVTSVWTTERSYYGGYSPKSSNGYNYQSTYDLTGPQWKPCYCVSTDGRNRRDSGRVGYIKIDDKLDSPFNEQQKTSRTKRTTAD